MQPNGNPQLNKIPYVDFSQLNSQDKPQEKKPSSQVLLYLVIFLLAIIGSFFLFLLWRNKQSTKSQNNNTHLSVIPTVADNLKITQIIHRSKKGIIGFLPSWIVAKQEKIHLNNLTQIIYFGLEVNSNGEVVQYAKDKTPVLEWTYFNSDFFTKTRNEASASGIKVLLTIKSFDNTTIDNLISNENATNRLINQLLNIIGKYKIDGINVDFEYVIETNFPTAKYFNRFLELLSSRIKKTNPNSIISVDINATAVIKDQAYDMVKIGETADQVILMAYDYYRAPSIKAGPVAPLSASENEPSVNLSLQSLIDRVPMEKIILGVPFYGYEWQTINGKYKSPAVQNSGALATYKRVRELIDNRNDLKLNWDEQAQSPWLTYRQSGAIKQIYYEDVNSITKKLEFVNNKNMAGIAIWVLGYEGKYDDLWQTIEKNFKLSQK